MAKSRVHVSELQLGMYVRELDRPWEETSFMFQGFTLETPADIRAVQSQCEYVVVDFLTHQSDAEQTRGNRALLNSKTQALDTRVMARDLSDAGEVRDTAQKAVVDIFDDMQMVRKVDGEAVKQVVSECVNSILKNPDAMLWYTQLQQKDNLLSRHSLNVAVLSIALGKQLGMRDFELTDLGTCGLLHDVGKTSLPAELLNKTGPLTEREQQQLKGHTLAGRNILLSSKSVFSGAADVAFSHHEHVDGSGYPRRVEGSKISRFSKIIAIANLYDNMVNGTAQQAPRSTTETLQRLYEMRGKAVDDKLVLSFIECVGVFPPGSLVELDNGEVGIVLSNNTTDKLRPRVIVILDQNNDPQPQRVVDLAQPSMADGPSAVQIKSTLRNGSYDVDVDDYIRAGLRIEGYASAAGEN